jgi:hypothetical protein
VFFLRITTSEVETNTRTPANIAIFHGLFSSLGGNPVLGSLVTMTVVVVAVVEAIVTTG